MAIASGKSLTTTDELRRQAEERLRAKAAGVEPPLSGEEMQRLVHELEVHQIELEMQNAELRQARDEIEKALERYTDLYDFAPIGYFNLDGAGVIRAANLGGASLLGIERSLLMGRRFDQFVAGEARPHFAAFLRKVFASRVRESCETTLAAGDNPPIFVQIEADAFGVGRGCRAAVIDITGRRRAEEALAEKRRELEELNRSLEMRISGAVDDLRQKDQMLILQDRRAVMGEMINNIAHQWRQPLNTLGLYLQELPIVYDTGTFSKEFLEENVAKSMDVILHMSRTIDDFRNFFRSDKEPSTFDVNQVIVRTLSLIEKSFQDQRITVDFQAGENPMVSGYPNEYAQVLLNILMNARDALVGHKVSDALISIRSLAEGDASVVTITDNGGGIADEIISRLFEPYFTTKSSDNGIGIGLFMSKAIIEKSMGGQLTVRNTGSGAEFRIQI
ncbi:PAS domain S-box protein [Oryzomonas japonica]|uniref:histidine kinase n=1 Tax=Oryzomonas japonica TaxID=2603858 RepID=A0A7J4ZNA4_9BACT|nr:PAS domain-containing sensor histidine kinase [Oryzomonas japonica]KAB0663791.1 PAS domain S-box protein [Oryzomonas japonica]